MDIGVGALFEIGKDIIGRVWPDPQKQAEEVRKLEELRQKGDLAELKAHVSLLTGQLEINKQEAAHPSIFIAGWRPGVGWICALGLLYISFIEPLMRFIANMNGYDGDFPEIDTTLTMQVLLGMLGLVASRSYDKKHKTDTKAIK